MGEPRAIASVHPEKFLDRVLVIDGNGQHVGYARQAEWQGEFLLQVTSLPEIRFENAGDGQELNPATVQRITFVHSFEAPDREPIQFYDGSSDNSLLWVRLRLSGDEDWREGFVENSVQLLRSSLIGLRPSDPESNERLILFPPAQIQDFQVLGLRKANSS